MPKGKLYWEICQNILGNLSWVLCLAYVQFFMGKYPTIILLVSRAKLTKLQYIYKILPRISHEIPTILLHNILGVTEEYLGKGKIILGNMSEDIGQFILGIMSGICPIFHGKVSHDNLARIKGKTHQTPIYI